MKPTGKGYVSRLDGRGKDAPKKLCDKWRIVIPTTGKPYTERFNGSYTAALNRKDEAYGELLTQVSDITFSEWAAQWLELRRKNPDVSKATADKNETQIGLLNRKIGRSKLADMTPHSLQGELLELREERNLSGTYMNQAFALCKRILEDAVDEGHMPSNPLRKVKPPKTDTKPKRALSRARMAKFLLMLDETPLDSHVMALHIAILSGLRRGEIVALMWKDIDSGVIRVRRAVDKDCNLAPTKTTSGIRDVPMGAILESKMGLWKELQRDALAAMGLEQTEETFVCPSVVGTLLHPENLARWWRAKRGFYGLEGVCLHELRHTYLTMLGSSGAASNSIKSLAGWSNILMANTYLHTDDDADREAVNQLEEMIRAEMESQRQGGM